MKASPAQTKFTGGIFSRLLFGRVDSERYPTGVADLVNYIVLIQGPVTRRPGSLYVAPTYGAGSVTARLKRFIFSTTQAYLLEFSNLKLRFYRNNAAILEANVAITGITQANPGVVTAVAHGFSNGDEVEIAAVTGMTQVNGRRFTVAGVTANTFQLSGVNTTAYTAYAAGGTVARVYTLTTPYVTADLFNLMFTQSADVLYVTHNNYEPRKITRTAHTVWSVNIILFLDGPYLTANSTTTTITPSATTGVVTLTASAPVFTSTDAQGPNAGRFVRIKHSSTWGYAVITNFASSTSVTASVINAFGAATASANWRLGLNSLTTGYPSAVTFSGDRLFFGGTTSYPQRFDGSKLGDYENFAPTDTAGVVTTDSAVSFTTNSNDVQAILWMTDNDKGLLIGTTSGEWIARPSVLGEVLSATNIDAKQFTFYGSAPIEPVKAGESVLFVQKQRRKLREITFVQQTDKFTSPDLTRVAEHISQSGFKQIAYTQEPQGIVWATLVNGAMAACTFERDLDGSVIAAWHSHAIGGYGDASNGPALVESMEIAPSADGLRDDVWMVVKRYIGGQTVRYVEYLDKLFDEEDSQSDMHFVDSGVVYNGTPATVLSGLWHLEGQSVAILGDGAIFPAQTVTNGQITMTSAVSQAHLGFAYNSDGQRLRDEAGAADGTALGKTRRTNRLAFLFDRVGQFKIGPDFSTLTPLYFRTPAVPMGDPPPLFTGIHSEPFDGPYDFDGSICWRQDTPTSGTILAIAPQLTTQDRG